uniref:NRL4 n=1 Tax=Arundo donax TaxID=35708 RepID=A0A0A9FZ86_ARUDO
MGGYVFRGVCCT